MNTVRARGIDLAWHSSAIDRRSAELIAAGIDVGFTSSQAVIVADDDILAYSTIWNRGEESECARQALTVALQGLNISESDIDCTAATGCGATGGAPETPAALGMTVRTCSRGRLG